MCSQICLVNYVQSTMSSQLRPVNYVQLRVSSFLYPVNYVQFLIVVCLQHTQQPIYMYTELIPTSVRNTGFGIAGIFSFLGSTIAPYTRTLSRHVPWAPGVVIGSLCLLVPVTTRILPETKGHELTQTLDDLDKIMKKTSIIETKL
ncbi:hypothetical protein Btru_066079 [Bulinus truncatus]|nr:hypothetical protein Btru_066079 [Bulinus truncatus]